MAKDIEIVTIKADCRSWNPKMNRCECVWNKKCMRENKQCADYEPIELDRLIEKSIEVLQSFAPPNGEPYYVAYSGGKDSIVLLHLVKMSGVPFDAHYNLTTIDPPPVVQAIKANPDISINYPKRTMWQLIEKKGLPTRLRRWCCKELKEGGGNGRFVLTGVRWAESPKRATRGAVEVSQTRTGRKERYNFDNEGANQFKFCPTKGAKILNPIINWKVGDIWAFIERFGLEYPAQYDEGWSRLGCIACPLGNSGKRDFEIYPTYRVAFEHALKRYFEAYPRPDGPGNEKEWIDWYISGGRGKKVEEELFAREDEEE